MWGYGPHSGWMGYGYGYGYGIIHMIFWVLVLIAIVIGVVWLVRSRTGAPFEQAAPRRSAGLDVLEERYARGKQ